jgi:hypothetical protein
MRMMSGWTRDEPSKLPAANGSIHKRHSATLISLSYVTHNGSSSILQLRQGSDSASLSRQQANLNSTNSSPLYPSPTGISLKTINNNRGPCISKGIGPPFFVPNV